MHPEPERLEAGAMEHKHQGDHRTQEHERPEPERLDAGATTGAGTQIKIKYTNAARSIGQQCKKVKKILRIKKKAVPLQHKPKHKKQ